MQIKSKHEKYINLLTWHFHFNDFTEACAAAVNEYPFHGVMIELIGAYNSNPINTDVLLSHADRIKSILPNKHFWPWIFLNRMIGYNLAHSHSGSSPADTEYFRNINGIDIYNETGALDDFKLLFRIALRSAFNNNQPGIVIDMEHYNDYSMYWIDNLSAKLGRTEDEIKVRLVEIGQELGTIVNEEYPEAIIWMLFTDLPNTNRTTSYITKGLLEYANETNANFKIVTGGQVGAKYCHIDLSELKEVLKERHRKYYKYLQQYPHLEFGAPFAPWLNVEVRHEYWEKGICGESKLVTIDDFKPLLLELFKHYNYIWAYTTTRLGTDILYPTNGQKVKKFYQDVFLYL